MRAASLGPIITALVFSFTFKRSARAYSRISKQSRRNSGSPPLMLKKKVPHSESWRMASLISAVVISPFPS